ncbi:hypothetical protein [Leptospira santarosai]|uniref:hypothetical protein n=1 Tax=Leptospira santarosai TaxID=28183 RepID=UPI00129026CF|nr:hypothetical protein [Leptospira santarosai]
MKRFPMGRVWKLSETLPKGRVWKLSETLPKGRVSGSYRIFVKSKDNVVKSPFGDYHMMKNVFL